MGFALGSINDCSIRQEQVRGYIEFARVPVAYSPQLTCNRQAAKVVVNSSDPLYPPPWFSVRFPRLHPLVQQVAEFLPGPFRFPRLFEVSSHQFFKLNKDFNV